LTIELHLAKKLRTVFDELEVKVPEETPLAVAKMLIELTKAHREPLNVKKLFPVCFPYKGPKKIITIAPMRFYTLCEHHMLPFFGYVHYAYIPNEKIVGLSKPPRVVQHYSKMFQIQERFTDQIDEALWNMVEPVAHVVETDAVHLCAIMRGVRTPDESVRVRNERVNEEIYESLGGKGHLYHLIKDLLSKEFRGREFLRHLGGE